MDREPCDPNSEEQVSATTAISDYVRGIVRGAFRAAVRALFTAPAAMSPTVTTAPGGRAEA
ncbi:hypothetical protein ACWDSD_14960 [Streptomyces spiralis]